MSSSPPSAELASVVEPLTGRQKRHLRALAHHLPVTVHVGKEGLTAALQRAVDQALEDHELIKVKVLEGAPVDRAEAAAELASSLSAYEAGRIGRIVMLYRPHPKEPRIALPA
jgi:RNA-binding protein